MTKPSSLLWVLSLCLLVWLGASAPSSAFPIPHKTHRLSVDITLQSVLEYHTRNTEEQRSAHAIQYVAWQNRLNLQANVDDIRFGGRLDTFNFFADAAPCPRAAPNCKEAYLPEKLFFQIRLGDFDFTVGDFYLTIGRGIALAVRKVDEFGIDTTLRGARATYQKEGFRATVAGGFSNANNFEPVQQIILDDPHDFFFAADIEQRFLKLFSLAGHYVFGQIQQLIVDSEGKESVAIRTTSHIAGGRISFPRLLNKMDIYFEGNLLFETNNAIAQDPGVALYLNYNGYFFPFTLQIEGQWYQHYRLETRFPQRYSRVPSAPLLYLNQPSMERPDLDTQADNANSKGVRIRLDYTFLNRKAVVHANYLFRYGFTPFDTGVLMIHHGYAGFEYHGDIVHLNTSGGFRQILGLEYWRLIHGDIDLNIRFAPRHAIDIVGRYWFNMRGAGIIEGIPIEEQLSIFHLVDAQIAYTFSGIGSLSFMFSYTNENSSPSIRQFYFAGELKINLNRYGALKLFFGNSRGGLRCVSGLCRVFPPFEGFRTELLFRI